MIFYDDKGKMPFVILSGTTGTGKNWITGTLESRRFKQVRTKTTRPPRDEKDKTDYVHVTEEQMDEIFDNFCQRYSTNGTRYGCEEDDILDIVKLGSIPILISSPSAVMDMFKNLGDGINKYSIFYVHIKAHPDAAFYNLTSKSRTDNAITIAKRIYNTDVEIREQYEIFENEFIEEFLASGNNDHASVSNSTEALMEIIEKYYLGVAGEI